MRDSHRTLRIFLQEPGRNGFLLIACIDPLHMQAPVSWKGAQIEITADDGDGYLVLDPAAGVRIRARSVDVSEFD